jgi:hypothetical protein
VFPETTLCFANVKCINYDGKSLPVVAKGHKLVSMREWLTKNNLGFHFGKITYSIIMSACVMRGVTTPVRPIKLTCKIHNTTKETYHIHTAAGLNTK